MKKILELIVCFFHPVAVVLGWIDLARRDDLTTLMTVAWAVFLIIPIVPFLYVLVGGQLWGRRP
jgi:ACR3 family arsenite efflux pump ArsB